jgi:hypothetical protein
MRQVRRRLIAADGLPLCTGEFLAWAYPHVERFKHWHRHNCRRALLRYAMPLGRGEGQGRPVIWAARDMTRHGGKTSWVRNALSHD